MTVHYNGHLLTRNGQTWVCTQCHEVRDHEDDYWAFRCTAAQKDDAAA